jgi:hypothetical protein
MKGFIGFRFTPWGARRMIWRNFCRACEQPIGDEFET